MGSSSWRIIYLNFSCSYSSVAILFLLLQGSQKVLFYFLKDVSAKIFLILVYILIKQLIVQSNLVSTSQHGCTGVECHQTIGTSGTVGHVISTHQSGPQAVPLKTPHHPVPLVQITHVSGSHGTISWWRSIIRHWFTCNLHKILFILHCLLFNRRGRFIQHYLYVDEVLYKRSSLRQQLSRRLLPDGFRGRQMSSLHLHKCVEGFF